MGNLEKPLTWGLVIVFIGYLFIANCKCGEESTWSLNDGFNFSNTEVLKADVPEIIEEAAVAEAVEEETKAEETTEETTEETDVAEEVATEE
jgi:hypothetical protein